MAQLSWLVLTSETEDRGYFQLPDYRLRLWVDSESDGDEMSVCWRCLMAAYCSDCYSNLSSFDLSSRFTLLY